MDDLLELTETQDVTEEEGVQACNGLFVRVG